MIEKFKPWVSGIKVPAPLDYYRCRVEPEWVDYNNHMTEAAYLTAFGWASDVLFQFIGINDDYRASGSSFYTVETHILYEKEVALGAPLRITTQVLGLDNKRLHINHQMFHLYGEHRLATCEQMLLHVDSKLAKASSISSSVFEALQAIVASHGTLDIPKEVGHTMTIPGKKG